MDLSAIPSPTSVIKNKFKFTVSCGIFAIAVALLVTHANTGFSVAFIGAVIAAITLIFAWKDAWRLIKKVDFKTLLFFVGLFIVVGGLEQTGVLTTFAEFIAKLCGGNTMLMVAIIIWVSGIASAFVDNIPFAATMVPVIGTDIGGSATPIGASANVVGISMAFKAGHTIGWGKYVKSALPATIIVLVVATIVIWIRYL